MDENEKILAVFEKTNIEGVDFSDGIARFGGNPKLYIRIITTFVDNIGKHLDVLAGLTLEGLEEYGIVVHGVKGSCYGISANKEGGMAKDLEIAAKQGDFDRVTAGNVIFINAVNELVVKLQAMLADIERRESEAGREKRPMPDKVLLAVMLQASRDFNVNGMQEALKGLEQYEYDSGGDLIKWLGEQVTAFGYDRIEERLASIL